ncbi:Initiator Replication protein [Alkalibacterium gilvum]|uniref:Initiator Replication protein n=1 Tax=Alkalibacterium gilvum TaxID=1130080 RepID=A0A1H6W794_9LACT|nr:replication initiation protein [Alkalibacterium gilvum]SEJ09927.1 Initiator Replication protein [Alkalibacterium gilvum]
MANIKVRYKNELNLVPMRNFDSVEMNLFFSICAKMKDKGLSKVQFTFEDLRELSAYKPTSIKRFSDDLEAVYNKMLQLTYRTEEAGIREKFVLFTGYRIDENNQTVDISVNPELAYIINELSSEFTKFELQEFTGIRSSYAKTMYRLLKQYRSTGFYKVKIEDFREILSIPNSYQMSDIDKQVLKPIKNELSEFFDSLKIKKIKARKGNRIAMIEFRFKEKQEFEPVPMVDWMKDFK